MAACSTKHAAIFFPLDTTVTPDIQSLQRSTHMTETIERLIAAAKQLPEADQLALIEIAEEWVKLSQRRKK